MVVSLKMGVKYRPQSRHYIDTGEEEEWEMARKWTAMPAGHLEARLVSRKSWMLDFTSCPPISPHACFWMWPGWCSVWLKNQKNGGHLTSFPVKGMNYLHTFLNSDAILIWKVWKSQAWEASGHLERRDTAENGSVCLCFGWLPCCLQHSFFLLVFKIYNTINCMTSCLYKIPSHFKSLCDI